MVYSAC